MTAGESDVRSAEGSLAFTELASQDPKATQRFLEAAFGWKFRTVRMPMGDYLSYETPDGRGGVRPVAPKEAPSSLAYVRVSDLAESQKKVERAGGTIVLPRVDVPGMGCFFWFRVPGGPVLACWQDLSVQDPPKTENTK
jgi:uncharacterized protein